MTKIRTRVKEVLGELPAIPETYQALIKNQSGGFDLSRLTKELPTWMAAAQATDASLPNSRVLVIGSLSWWIEFSSALAVLLSGRGCQVDFGFIPFWRWTDQLTSFDKRRQSAYMRSALAPMERIIGLQDLSKGTGVRLAEGLQEQIERISRADVQYTVGREWLDSDPGSRDHRLFSLRMERNRAAALAMIDLVEREQYDVVVIPNGGILEFAAVRAAATWSGLRTVTFEFGEQRERIWIAQNDQVMRQDTSPLWDVCSKMELTSIELKRLADLNAARKSGQSWEQFKREWQASPATGARAVADALDLDLSKPVVLLCTNVMGDSLAIDREIFTEGMGDWLLETVRHFANNADAQLVVRIHPGEIVGAGHPSAEIVESALPMLPDHVSVVPPDSELNTYDLIEIADLGLVYTSTVGMEMVTQGVPVIIAGETHYRNRGFTHDPDTLEEYFHTIDQVLASDSEVNQPLANRYAYRFFFDYPFEFPWHLLEFWDDIQARPVEDVVQSEGSFGGALEALIGMRIDWSQKVGQGG